jgi:hypothetical protein
MATVAVDDLTAIPLKALPLLLTALTLDGHLTRFTSASAPVHVSNIELGGGNL